MQLAGVAPGHRLNVLCEELRCVVFGDRAREPGRQRQVPAQIVPAHLLIVGEREDHHVVGFAKIELAGCGAQRPPLQGVLGNQNAGLFGDGAGVVGLSIELVGIDRAAHQHAVRRGVRAQRARSADLGESGRRCAASGPGFRSAAPERQSG